MVPGVNSAETAHAGAVEVKGFLARIDSMDKLRAAGKGAFTLTVTLIKCL